MQVAISHQTAHAQLGYMQENGCTSNASKGKVVVTTMAGMVHVNQQPDREQLATSSNITSRELTVLLCNFWRTQFTIQQ